MKRIIPLFLILMLTSAQVKWEKFMCCGGTAAPSCDATHGQGGTYLARTTITTNATNVANYICGLVSAGLITGNLTTTGCGSLFDGLYIFATDTSADADLNVCSNTNYNLTEHNTPIFTANTGWVGNAGTQYLDTGFNPTTASAPNYTQNNSHMSVWVSTNNVNNDPKMGAFQTGVSFSDIYTNFAGNSYFRINDGTASGADGTTFTGHYVATRISGTTGVGYVNAVNQSIPAAASGTPPNENIYILNENQDGSPSANATKDNIMVASFGANLTSGQVSTFCNLTNVYLTAVAGVSSGIC